MNSQTPATGQPSRGQFLKLIPRKIFSIILIGAFIGPMGGIIVSVALPTIARAYSADIQSVKWVVMIYLVATSCLLPIFGRIGRWAGEERLFTLGFAISALGTVACAFAPEDKLWLLVSFRVIHAVGSSMVFALLASLLAKHVPAKTRGLAFGLVGATVGVSLVAGIFACGAFLWGRYREFKPTDRSEDPSHLTHQVTWLLRGRWLLLSLAPAA
ncbi:MAG: MFS transporter, partial [Proteobacteria bacterium]|nr:MFS transporter [Pseudomonadota bacterium]